MKQSVRLALMFPKHVGRIGENFTPRPCLATARPFNRVWWATEVGCPADKMADSAQMNMGLHQTVLQKLAANGGNVPQDLLH
jgi:hypothetical protein